MVLPFARGRSRANDAPPTWVFAVLPIVPRGDGAKLAPKPATTQSSGDPAGSSACARLMSGTF